MALNLPKPRKTEVRASFFKRILAFGIDIAILNFILGYAFGGLVERILPEGDFMSSYEFLLNNPAVSRMLYTLMLSATGIVLLYFIIFEYKMQQTPGKMIFRLKVKSLGKKLKLWQCIVRPLFIIPFFPIILLWVIDPVYAFFNKEGQRLLERWSKTKVVESFYY